MKPRLLLKIFAINAVLIVLVVLLLWVILDTLAASYFSALMDEYGVEPYDAHRMFLHAIHRYLIWTSVAAVLVAGALSYLLTRKALRPLEEMSRIARGISRGDYGARVQSHSTDEIGALASTFNRMAENLEQIERLRRNLVSDVAHELRGPLTNVRGYVEGLQDGVVPATAGNLELIHEETMRLIELVEDLLTLANADAAGLSLKPEPVDVREMITGTLRGFEPELAGKKLTASLELDAIHEPLEADPKKLRMVFQNLFDNACRYTPPGGSIRVTAATDDHLLRLDFTNSGPGIAAEDLPFIFERFYRAEKSRSREFGGAGIGLAIVKQMVEAHHGRVEAESQPGETLFRVTLPLKQPA